MVWSTLNIWPRVWPCLPSTLHWRRTKSSWWKKDLRVLPDRCRCWVRARWPARRGWRPPDSTESSWRSVNLNQTFWSLTLSVFRSYSVFFRSRLVDQNFCRYFANFTFLFFRPKVWQSHRFLVFFHFFRLLVEKKKKIFRISTFCTSQFFPQNLFLFRSFWAKLLFSLPSSTNSSTFPALVTVHL